MELTIHALSHSYGDKKALTDFTHTFTPGITALLGPNGAGKSTLIHLICDLLPRQTGTIAFDGTDILSMGPAFRQVLGFMPQSQGMYDDMTAWEFLLYMAQLKGLRPRAAREQLRELLQVVNLWDAAHRRVGGFSGGMRQRVMLAQALLGAPKVLLLDEPTAGLDPEERVRLREYIRQLGRDKIVLITTHITGDVESIASEILLLHHGVLLADAPALKTMADIEVSAFLERPLLRSVLFEKIMELCREDASSIPSEKYLTGRRLLIVDDMEINRLVVQLMLESAGAVVEQAENGRQALTLFQESPVGYYDAILMDVMGHGVSAAFIAVFLQSAASRLMQQNTTPGNLLNSLGQQMWDIASLPRQTAEEENGVLPSFLSAICFDFDLAAEKLHWANAGHLPALLRLPDATILKLESTAPPLGLFPANNLKTQTVSLPVGCRIIAFSDGILENHFASIGAGIETLSELLSTTDASSPAAFLAALEKPLRPLLPVRDMDDACVMAIDILSKEL